MVGDYTRCTAMFGNGAGIGLGSILLNRRLIPWGLLQAVIVCAVAAAGAITANCAVQPPAVGLRQSIVTSGLVFVFPVGDQGEDRARGRVVLQRNRIGKI